MVDLDEQKGKELQDNSEGKVAFHAGDISQLETWEQIAVLAQDRFGSTITTVVNNAGITFEPKVGFAP